MGNFYLRKPGPTDLTWDERYPASYPDNGIYFSENGDLAKSTKKNTKPRSARDDGARSQGKKD